MFLYNSSHSEIREKNRASEKWKRKREQICVECQKRSGCIEYVNI